MTLGIGVPPSGRARERGLRPALATDAVCSASGDLFEEARLALVVERALRGGGPARPDSGLAPPVPTAREALDGITLDAARACWLDDRIGSLSIGKRADIVLLRGLDVGGVPAVELPAVIVGSAHGSNIDTVIVGGEIVKRNGRLLGIDRGRIRGALAASRERLFAEAGYPQLA
jgi:5-methylthioadenosine/S-adenosylhomocysteine deaminase